MATIFNIFSYLFVYYSNVVGTDGKGVCSCHPVIAGVTASSPIIANCCARPNPEVACLKAEKLQLEAQVANLQTVVAQLKQKNRKLKKLHEWLTAKSDDEPNGAENSGKTFLKFIAYAECHGKPVTRKYKYELKAGQCICDHDAFLAVAERVCKRKHATPVAAGTLRAFLRDVRCKLVNVL